LFFEFFLLILHGGDIKSKFHHFYRISMQIEKGFSNTSTSGGYVPKPGYRPETKFERRGLRLGHGVWDLVFEKIN